MDHSSVSIRSNMSSTRTHNSRPGLRRSLLWSGHLYVRYHQDTPPALHK